MNTLIKDMFSTFGIVLFTLFFIDFIDNQQLDILGSPLWYFGLIIVASIVAGFLKNRLIAIVTR